MTLSVSGSHGTMIVDPDSGAILARVGECSPAEHCFCYAGYDRIDVANLQDGEEYDVLLVYAWIDGEYVPPDETAMRLEAESGLSVKVDAGNQASLSSMIDGEETDSVQPDASD